MALLIEHRGKSPHIDRSAYIAPNAVISGDVRIGAHSRVLFGAVLTAEGGPVVIGENCINHGNGRASRNTAAQAATRTPRAGWPASLLDRLHG